MNIQLKYSAISLLAVNTLTHVEAWRWSKRLFSNRFSFNSTGQVSKVTCPQWIHAHAVHTSAYTPTQEWTTLHHWWCHRGSGCLLNLALLQTLSVWGIINASECSMNIILSVNAKLQAALRMWWVVSDSKDITHTRSAITLQVQGSVLCCGESQRISKLSPTTGKRHTYGNGMFFHCWILINKHLLGEACSKLLSCNREKKMVSRITFLELKW